MRYLFFTCVLLTTARVVAQQDTVLLKPIDVIGFSEEKYLTGASFTNIDSAFIRQNIASHLGEMLSLQLPIYFRNYGNSGISGISLRGTAPQHTAVLWNGININSLSHGQADFSMLPASAVDNIKVHEGGGSSRFGSGAFGGTILINSRSSVPSEISFTQEVGSFGRYFTNVGANISGERISSGARVYRQISDNDFPVRETGKNQPHAAYLQQGVLADVSYAITSMSEIALHYWFHDSDREIQPTIGQTISDDNQQDRSHRASLNYKHHFTRALLSFNTGYTNDVINYNNDRSTVERFTGKFSLQSKILKNLNADLFGEANAINATLRNYENGIAKENRYDIGASFSYNPNERLLISFNLRQPFVTGFTAPLLPYVGVQYNLMPAFGTNVLNFRANLSRNYRVPTLNDRYWLDAGSTDLLPETSLASESGLSWISEEFSLSGDLFYQHVSEWIIWEPQQGGNWVPQNINEVVAKGAQLKSRYKTKISQLAIDGFVTWQYTQSTITETSAQRKHTIGTQLIYTPFHTGSAGLKLLLHNFSITPAAQFSGKRFTDTSNDELYALPHFFLYNTAFGYETLIKHHRFNFSFAVKNLTNTNYQLYAARAMPGRNYSLQINYQLNLTRNTK